MRKPMSALAPKADILRLLDHLVRAPDLLTVEYLHLAHLSAAGIF